MDLVTYLANVRAADQEEKRRWLPFILGYVCMVLALYGATQLLHLSDLAEGFAAGAIILAGSTLGITMYRDHESRSRRFDLRCPKCGASFFTRYNNPEISGKCRKCHARIFDAV
jgi:hypothetical protein